MKKALIMLSVLMWCRLLAAEGIALSSLQGEHWYGVYINGQKSGYSMSRLILGTDGTVETTEDSRFRVNMAGQKQDMRIVSRRSYGANGRLSLVDTEVDDSSGKSAFRGKVTGDSMELSMTVAGATRTLKIPAPKETVQDMLKQVKLAGPGAKPGDEATFTVFEPAYQRELSGTSRVEAIEERNIEGSPVRVLKIKTSLPSMGLDSYSYVTQDGTLLEDEVSGFIKMRLEPKEVAQDVSYNNDVLVSNAALLPTPIAEPRTRPELRLYLEGPLGDAHRFEDERQHFEPVEGGFTFIGRKLATDGLKAPVRPVAPPDDSVGKYLKPSTFVQSADPRLIAKAKEIIGDEADAFKAAAALCHWTAIHVRSTYSARLSNALEVLDSMQGDCTEHTVLFTGLARAAGIPAREVAGLVYTDGARPGFYFHQWAEVWVGRWIAMDPTFDQPSTDATHIKLAEGDLFEQARVIPLIGQIKVRVEGN